MDYFQHLESVNNANTLQNKNQSSSFTTSFNTFLSPKSQNRENLNNVNGVKRDDVSKENIQIMFMTYNDNKAYMFEKNNTDDDRIVVDNSVVHNNKNTNMQRPSTSQTITTTIQCNNCGIKGHMYGNCKYPITSIGIIAYKFDTTLRQNVYLMIRRRNSLGFVEFMRGKYNLCDKQYLQNLINEMTIKEKDMLKTQSFEMLWRYLWNNKTSSKHNQEERISKKKFILLKNGASTMNEYYTLSSLLKDSTTQWYEEEWGFPKGRRNNNEKDIHTATREFQEETGLSQSNLSIIRNILPFEEIFTGSNYKSYKHKYYLAHLQESQNVGNSALFQECEVSKMEWKTLDECVACIRPYNKERIELIREIDDILQSYMILHL